MKISDEYLSRVSGGGNISNLTPVEVRRLQEYLGNDDIVVCYARGESNGGEIGDGSIMVVPREDVHSEIHIINGIPCVHLPVATILSSTISGDVANIGDVQIDRIISLARY